MEPRRQREVVMGAIAALIVGVAGYKMYSMPSTSESATAAATSAHAAQTPTKRDPNGLDLDALHGQRPVPVETDRNPFRFKPKQAPPPPSSQTTRPVTQPQPPTQP